MDNIGSMSTDNTSSAELTRDKLTRRAAVTAGILGAVGLTGCSGTSQVTPRGVVESSSSRRPTASSPSVAAARPQDPAWSPLKPGEKPPQFVVISWDGAGEVSGLNLLSHFLGVAKKYHAPMTMFLSGLFFLPRSKRMLYHPPRHPVGASDIGYLDDGDVHSTIRLIGQAWREGHEIGTHFNGHFCGANGVQQWSVADWRSEIAQAKSFVRDWRANTGFTDLPDLPFDYDKELVGGRTPCLEGADNLRKAADGLGWRYDSSKGNPQMWPKKDGRLWDLSMQSIPFAGHSGSILSMDYNIMFNQTGGTTRGDPAKRPGWRTQARDTFLAGFRRAYDSNRAPLIIGNHFEGWNGGIYMEAVEQAIAQMADYPDTKFVTFRQLCDWLDVQQPVILTKLRRMAFGMKPTGGWEAATA